MPHQSAAAAGVGDLFTSIFGSGRRPRTLADLRARGIVGEGASGVGPGGEVVQFKTLDQARNFSGPQGDAFLNSTFGGNPFTSQAGEFGVGASGDPVDLVGLQAILDILLSRGQVPRTSLNQEISGIQRSGQSAQQQTRAALARRGLGGSGIGEAIQAAISANTGAQVAGREAAFTQEAEERRRRDLELFFRLLGIRTDRQALSTGQFQFDQTRSDQRDAARDARNVQLLGLGLDFLPDLIDIFRNRDGGETPPPALPPIPGFDGPVGGGPVFF